ncbi:hypothetical protein P691DRAFT_480852 [Macrolepiota fuliginosa MF-IS2]|uniref:Uncharacterized protein n=1 Tax=Macrolepiota fuliginosa MF-IS2 TaxID=1400762 RepID=A0A9P6C6G7_9AGAR|nr:hypothetical protein P691DRAFT_480852 [Macrolepiota fuliginosa MF-IS2]
MFVPLFLSPPTPIDKLHHRVNEFHCDIRGIDDSVPYPRVNASYFWKNSMEYDYPPRSVDILLCISAPAGGSCNDRVSRCKWHPSDSQHRLLQPHFGARRTEFCGCRPRNLTQQASAFKDKFSTVSMIALLCISRTASARSRGTFPHKSPPSIYSINIV